MSSPYDKAGTALQGVHTLLAMPQWYINYNLANLLQSGTTTDGGSLKDVRLTLGGDAWLTGVIERMWTEVYVANSTSRVKFVLLFASGTMDYFDLIAKKDATADVAGLQFGFDVDLSYADVAVNQSLPPDV